MKKILLTLVVAVALVSVSGHEASAAPGKCEAAFFLDPLCEAGKTVAGKAKDLVTAPFRYVAGGAVDMMTSWVSDTAQWILKRVISFIDDTTTPTLDAAWFAERYRFMIGLASLVLVPMLLLAAIRSIVSQDAGQLLRSFFLYLPIAVLATFVAVFIVQATLAITDSMSAAVADGVAGDASQIFDGVGTTISDTAAGTGGAPSFAIFFGSIILVIGAFAVWLELLVRSAAVTMTVFFLPLILAGLVWPATARWTKRAIEALAAIILSKFVIVAVISLATAAMSDPGRGGFGTVMGASALMLMAAFSPFMLLRLIPAIEQGGIDHLQGAARRPVQLAAAHGPVPHVLATMRRSRPAVAGGVAGGSSAVVGAQGGGRSANPSAGGTQPKAETVTSGSKPLTPAERPKDQSRKHVRLSGLTRERKKQSDE